MAKERTKGRKLLVRGIGGTIALLVVCIVAWAFPTVRDLAKAGFFQEFGERKYNGNTIQDLRAIRTALMLYHESEGQFPQSDHWMEAIQKHIRTDDMSGAEAAKKFVDPVYLGQAGKFGFAMNDATSGKYKGDIKDPKTPLIFESKDPTMNSHGDPAKLAPTPPHAGGNLGITIDGTIVRLK